MTTDDAKPDETDSTETGFGRRSLLRAMGVGTALSAAGVAGAQMTETPSGETATPGAETETPGAETETPSESGSGSVDPAFGFPALSGDVEPPVEPDHTVEIQIRPRDGSPIPEFFYQPTGLAVDPGESVMFTAVTPHHTVTAYHPAFGFQQRVPDGVQPFSSPVLAEGGYWLYTFDTEGVYDFHCGPHEAFGHAGRIVCGSVDGFEALSDLCAPGNGGGGMMETPAVESPGAETETPGVESPGAETETPVVESPGAETETPTMGGEEELRLPFLGAYEVLTDAALDPKFIMEQDEVAWDDLSSQSKRLFLQIEGFPPC